MGKSEQGANQRRFQTIPRCLMFITRGDEVLLIKGAPTKRIWANRYNGVGGHIERGEDALSAARRELVEETGLTQIDLWLSGLAFIDIEEALSITLFIFRGEYQGGELTPSDEGDLEWVSRDKIMELPLVEDLFVVLPRLLALPKNAAPIFLRYAYDESDQLVVTFIE